MKKSKILWFTIIFLSLYLINTSISYGLDSFYTKGEIGIGYGYGIGRNFEVIDRMEVGIGLPHDLSFSVSKYGADIDIGVLYNLGFPFRQRGIASWYGSENHGHLTASGESYNMYAYTAAHRTLPFGTLVKVTNLKNGKSVVVRINDRGPFVKNRIIDLSYASAKKIGLLKEGTAPVTIEVLDVSGLSIKMGYETGPYVGTFHIGGLFEFPLAKNISGILELRFLPSQPEFTYGGGVIITVRHPFKIKIGIDNASSTDSPNIFLEMMLKF